MILYDPAVPGAVNPLTRYFPVEPVVVLGMVIEVAVNDIVFELRVVPVVVSIRVPDMLYVPLAATDDGETIRVRETLCFSVL